MDRKLAVPSAISDSTSERVRDEPGPSIENVKSPLDTAEFYGTISFNHKGPLSDQGWGLHLSLLRSVGLAIVVLAAAEGTALAQQHIGSTVLANNEVTRELSGSNAPLTAGEDVFRNEIVKTGVDSTAKLVFLDSTNLGVGPVSRVTLDQFVYVGEMNGQKMTVNLVRGVFRFTTGKLDKNAYLISTPLASVGVRGTVLDIGVQNMQSRVTLVEGQALVCPRRQGITFAQQARNCARAAGGAHCECVDLNNAGQTALVKKSGGSNEASLTSTPVNFASNCAGNASLCSGSSYASATTPGGGGGFPAGALCGR
jgi:FecR protein